eukprot:4252251-Prymnesium_polylepis.1
MWKLRGRSSRGLLGGGDGHLHPCPPSPPKTWHMGVGGSVKVGARRGSSRRVLSALMWPLEVGVLQGGW